MNKKIKVPWPTKAVMTQIYEQKLWGGTKDSFYSGWGSHNPDIINPYIETLNNFFKSFSKPLKVCDLGCGDFNIGKHFVENTKTYIAIDIVESLIEKNKAKFKAENLEFKCLDVSKDKLPEADCIILRQVLQHLSNTEIQQILEKLADYKYLMLTEHIPLGDFILNKDIISGQGIRLKQNSGVSILEAPFNLDVKKEKILDKCILENNKGQIVTTLYGLF